MSNQPSKAVDMILFARGLRTIYHNDKLIHDTRRHPVVEKKFAALPRTADWR
jgi:hypothetical protein